jgi:hypothetical protein
MRPTLLNDAPRFQGKTSGAVILDADTLTLLDMSLDDPADLPGHPENRELPGPLLQRQVGHTCWP